MFLAGLKFALGLMAGIFVVLGVLIGIIALAEWATNCWRKWHQSTDPKIVAQAEPAIERRNRVLIVLRHPGGADHPARPVHRSAKYLQ